MKSLENQIYLFLNKYTQNFPTISITVALSMGSDSMALLYLLNNLKKKYNFQLSACHLNHGIREESKIEQEEFIKLMNELDLPYYTEKLEIPEFIKKSNKSFELWARKERLKFYESARNKLKSDYVATAHNMDDIIETFFLNLLRGTGLIGASSIQPKRGYLIRPVYEISKEELKEYCDKNKIKYFEDKTNKDNTINRNYIRNIILQNIYKRFNNSSKRIFSFIKEINSTIDFINSFTPAWFQNNEWSIKEFSKLSNYLQSFFLYRKIREISISNDFDLSLLNISRKKIDDALDKIKTIKNGYVEKFPFFDIFIAYEKIYFIEKKICNEDKIELRVDDIKGLEFNKVLSNGYKISIKLETDLNSSNIKEELNNLFIIKKSLCGEKLIFSNWNQGDKIKLQNYEKKLQDIFVDWKIPRPYRNNILVIKNDFNIIGLYLPFNFANKSNYILSKDYYVDFDEKVDYILMKIEKLN
ncbi:MAG: tRNA lysidine(34) synthetase TilS [Spirochaetota bacterium]